MKTAASLLALIATTCVIPLGAATPAERAIAAAQTTISKAPERPDGYVALAVASSRRARETADGRFYDQAEQAVAQALTIAPNHFEALRALAWISLGKHDFAKALELAKSLNKRAPDDVLVYGILTDACTESGNYEEAEKAAQWMLDLGRSGVPGLTRAAYLRELFGDIEGALELMRSAYDRIHASETEDRAWVLTHMAHLLNIAGKPEDGEKAAAGALELFPDYHYALAAMAKIRVAQGRHPEAAQLYRKRTELAPHPENFFDYAAALHRAGEQQLARRVFADFEKRARAEKDNVDNANRELARYYADYAAKPAEALRITSAEIKRRQDVYTADAHAWALYRNGRRTEARKLMQQVIAVGVRDPEILEHARLMRVLPTQRVASR